MKPEVASRPRSAVLVVAGLVALASAMGIGRFAFTPMLPLMQADGSVTLAQGAWLAFANYLGYLVGALACSWHAPDPRRAVRAGLVAVAALTLGMAAGDRPAVWWALRFGAGVASAVVLVGVAASVPAALAARGRGAWSGVVFAGVGVGIVAAGALGWAAGLGAWRPAAGWGALGLLSVVAAAVVWPALAATTSGTAPAASAAPRTALGREGWRLVLVYGVFGFGYIVPATFLPAAARAALPDPRVFGAVWPVFGAAAAASTLLAAFVLRGVPPRRLWAVAQGVMALGVGATALSAGLPALVVGAVCVGGTFVVATMAGLQEARRLGGPAAPRWIAAMTAAFAAGQLAGPFAVGLLAGAHGDGMARASAVAAVLLLVGAAALWSPARSMRTAASGGTT